MNLNGCEIDGVPAPSDWELCPDGLDRERAISRLRACIRQNLAVIAERDGYRAVAEQRAAEVERLAQEVERQDGFRTEVEARLADIESRLELATERNGRLTAEVARLRGELSERETTIRILSQSDVNRFKEVARLREAYDQLLEAGQQFHGEHLTGILDGRQCAHADEDSLNVFGSALVELEDLTPLTCDCGKGE